MLSVSVVCSIFEFFLEKGKNNSLFWFSFSFFVSKTLKSIYSSFRVNYFMKISPSMKSLFSHKSSINSRSGMCSSNLKYLIISIICLVNPCTWFSWIISSIWFNYLDMMVFKNNGWNDKILLTSGLFLRKHFWYNFWPSSPVLGKWKKLTISSSIVPSKMSL